LHRLQVLRLPWADKAESGRTRGTWKEVWQLLWRPEFALALVDAAAYGNTVAAAAARRIAVRANDAPLGELVELLEVALFADVPSALAEVLAGLAQRAAGTVDVEALLAAVPPLCRVTRYGDVRQSDGQAVRTIVHGLCERIHAALPGAASGIDDAKARVLAAAVREHRRALELLADDGLQTGLDETLVRLGNDGVHAQLRGLALRLRRDAGRIPAATVAATLGRELSAGAPPMAVAAWLDGFLTEAGSVLAHDATLLALLDGWVASLGDEHFQAALPLVRRTFATFAAGERTQIAAAVRMLQPGRVPTPTAVVAASYELDAARVGPALAAVARLLGIAERSAP
jgi:hypothetical protein